MRGHRSTVAERTWRAIVGRFMIRLAPLSVSQCNPVWKTKDTFCVSCPGLLPFHLLLFRLTNHSGRVALQAEHALECCAKPAYLQVIRHLFKTWVHNFICWSEDCVHFHISIAYFTYQEGSGVKIAQATLSWHWRSITWKETSANEQIRWDKPTVSLTQ